MLTTGNILAAGSPAFYQTLLTKSFLENYEPNTLFWRFGAGPVEQKGFDSVSWARLNVMKTTTAQALLTEGVTPAGNDNTVNVVKAIPAQYGDYSIITDLAEDETLLNIVSAQGQRLGANAARIIDNVIQTTLSDNTVVKALYAGGGANRASITATDTMTAPFLAEAFAYLATQAATTYNGRYIAIMHPCVAYDLQMSANNSAWVNKPIYDNVESIPQGFIGTLYGVDIYVSSNVQTYSSTVDVYPTFVFGKDAYGVSSLQALETYYHPRGTAGGDYLAQRTITGYKVAFGSAVLNTLGIVRLESAASVNFEWNTALS